MDGEKERENERERLKEREGVGHMYGTCFL